jgi:hypothetical protein
MNRILFEASEMAADGRTTFGGVRAEHVLTILHGEVGQTLKTGVVDGPIGTGVIERIDGETVTVTGGSATVPVGSDVIITWTAESGYQITANRTENFEKIREAVAATKPTVTFIKKAVGLIFLAF